MKRQQIQQQKQITAYEKKVTYDLFFMSMELLEKYIEVAHGNKFIDWEFRKQIHSNNIKRTDINGNPKMAKDTLSTQLLLFEANLRRRPEFIREEIKEEYYRWIDSVGIGNDNCPKELKGLLFGINEILEGRGEKIRKEAEMEKPIVSVEEMGDFFAHSHLMAKKEAETEKSLSGKTHRDIKIDNKFGGGIVDRGRNAFKKIAGNTSDYQNFSFFPSQEQKQESASSEFIVRQYELAKAKLSGQIPLEGWETREGLQQWIIELERSQQQTQIEQPPAYSWSLR